MTTKTKKKNKVINHVNYDYTKAKGIINTEPSKTIPGQAYSVREVIIRYRDGIPLNLDTNYSFDEEFGEGINPLREPDIDLVDLYAMQEKAMKKIAEFEEYNVKKQHKLKEEKRLAAINAEVERRLKNEQKETN